MRAVLPTEIIRTTEQLEALEPEWLELWRRAPDATPFQSPAWLLPWWRQFGSHQLSMITLRENGRLSGAAPLYVLREDDESLGMLLGTGTSDYLDVLTTGDVSPIVDEMVRLDCRMWDLQQLRPSSPLLQFVAPDGWSDSVTDQDRCPILSIGEGSPHLSTHFQKKLRYYRRSLSRLGSTSFETADASNIDALIEALFELHAARWQVRGMPGMLADDAIQRFHRQVIPRMLATGALRLHAMRIDARIVAVFYGFAHGGTVYYYLSGYDPELEKLSIGTVIVAHAIDEAIREGCSIFDFLRGAEEYKYAWGAADRINRRRQLSRV
jgi:CelD/BcsL family acetyltransferase involved in cellulose biosynthesis